MVVVMPDNQEDIYLLIEKEKYENCVPIASFDDRFLCINLPKLINKTVFIQIFKEGVEAPLAEGEIFLDQALIGSMQPTDTPQPPDPYAP